MIILKEKIFVGGTEPSRQLADFVNTNNIKREDIFTITQATTANSIRVFTIFYYGEA